MINMLNNEISLDEINENVRENAEQFILTSEKNYNRELMEVADVVSRKKGRTIVLLSGPSGSGKTTTAHKLQKALNTAGVHTIVISLDNFYLDREHAPKTEDGRFDFETVNALNIPQLQQCAKNLVETGYCDLPTFDFKLGKPDPTTVPTELAPEGTVILEGIHALNPLITSLFTSDNMIKMVVNVETTVKNGEKDMLKGRDIRMIRRVIRDCEFRNSSPSNTLTLWTNVVRGEEKYLLPFIDTADIRINTFHAYEVNVYRDILNRLFESIDENDENYETAQMIDNHVDYFTPLPTSAVPLDSLIREFLG